MCRFILLSTALLTALALVSGCNDGGLVDAPTPKAATAAARFNHAEFRSQCSKCHQSDLPKGPVGPEKFDHAKNGTGDCILCHGHNTGMRWSEARFNHDPAPATCVECHENDKPKEIVHQMNHARANLPDCATCHDKLGFESFKGAKFNHAPAPATCAECHAPNRPDKPVGNPPFDHAHGGTGDCVHCHVQGAGHSWKEVHFSHDPRPKHCAGCHTIDRPEGPVGPNAYNHATNDGLGDCVHCHSDNAGAKWEGGHFTHTPTPSACAECHTDDKPTELVNEMMHTHEGLPDCVTCHGENAGDFWEGAKFNHAPTPTTCEDCHGPQRPTAPVGKDGFVHAKRGTGDCAFCHAAGAGVKWQDGHMHHRPTPASCVPCHESDRPPVVKMPDGAHELNGHFAPRSCGACHQTPSKPQPKFAFAHLNADHKTVETCASCHQEAGVKAHGAAVKECNICHLGTASWHAVRPQ